MKLCKQTRKRMHKDMLEAKSLGISVASMLERRSFKLECMTNIQLIDRKRQLGA